MKKVLILLLLILNCFVFAQNREMHLIGNSKYRQEVHQRFLQQRAMGAGRDSALFSVFNSALSLQEKEALEFLYAFMPLSDLSMYDGSYYLAQAKSALEAKSFFNWGQTIPEDIFLHFVLPYRVNNEYTDTARQVFFSELKNRLEGLTMEQAALEVNHWCHEKVIYKGTDIRTSGPLTTVRTAFGRCGEESTFTTAAMRSVGIPARQVYTPRWAHTDDNHAWVEVWIDGKWKYLGACEPEPELNVGWFSEPVKRAMMTHTFVFGKYKGNEEVIESSDNYARLNLLKNYTDTKSLKVKVTNPKGEPRADAQVDFGLYNYAEFYPIAAQFTDNDGYCAITTGWGDLLVNARKDGRSSSAIARAGLTDTLSIVIGDKTRVLLAGEYIFTPPARQEIDAISKEKHAFNNMRLLKEDSIRNAYISTFIDSLAASSIIHAYGPDEAEIWKFIAESRGNWSEITKFISGLSPSQLKDGVRLLAQLAEKDLHDIQAGLLRDHLLAAGTYGPLSDASTPEVFASYILSPRIGREFITPWRSFIQKQFTADEASAFRQKPLLIRDWIAAHIAVDTINNYYGVPLYIEGILQLGRADYYSRDLLFVAISRSFGIPARLETATQRPQFLNRKGWNDVLFSAVSKVQPLRSTLVMINESEDGDFVPRYYIHYTIARYEHGNFVTLDYETDVNLLKFPVTLSIDTGFYRLITGNRMSGGEVVCNISYFRIEAGKTTEVGISLASGLEKTGHSGKADLSASFTEFDSGKPAKLNQYMGEEGMIVTVIDPSKEPTKHLMEDLRAVKQALDQWGGPVIFAVAGDKFSSGFNPKVYKELPDRAIFGHDVKGETAASISTVCSITGTAQWPVIALLNSKGEIIWHSEGYSIGLGDQLIKQIKKM